MFAMAKITDDVPLQRPASVLREAEIDDRWRYTSMKIGGPADYFIEVERRGCAVLVVRRHRCRCGTGNGSNVNISDRGVRGAVIHLAGSFKKAEWREAGDNVEVEVGAAYAVTPSRRRRARAGLNGPRDSGQCRRCAGDERRGLRFGIREGGRARRGGRS
jgi:UDP-N-acetylmuramate dehydrogenase